MLTYRFRVFNCKVFYLNAVSQQETLKYSTTQSVSIRPVTRMFTVLVFGRNVDVFNKSILGEKLLYSQQILDWHSSFLRLRTPQLFAPSLKHPTSNWFHVNLDRCVVCVGRVRIGWVVCRSDSVITCRFCNSVMPACHVATRTCNQLQHYRDTTW